MTVIFISAVQICWLTKEKAAQDKLDSMTINDGDHEYTLSLPDYSVKSKSVNYKVFTSEELEKCVTGEKP